MTGSTAVVSDPATTGDVRSFAAICSAPIPFWTVSTGASGQRSTVARAAARSNSFTARRTTSGASAGASSMAARVTGTSVSPPASTSRSSPRPGRRDLGAAHQRHVVPRARQRRAEERPDRPRPDDHHSQGHAGSTQSNVLVTAFFQVA